MLNLLLYILPAAFSLGLIALAGINFAEYKRSNYSWVKRYYLTASIALIEAAIIITLTTYLIVR
jgi:hypothetical protein